MRDVAIIGVGMIKFGRYPEKTVPELAAQAAHLALRAVGQAGSSKQHETSVALFDQGLTQVLEASVTGLEPLTSYILALTAGDESGALQPLATFKTNSAGAAVALR